MSRYILETEHVRGEKRIYWIEDSRKRHGRGFEQVTDHTTDRRKAERWLDKLNSEPQTGKATTMTDKTAISREALVARCEEFLRADNKKARTVVIAGNEFADFILDEIAIRIATLKTPEQLAQLIIDRANNGYHNESSGYPPFALTAWDDRLRWSNYIKKVAAEVLTEELS